MCSTLLCRCQEGPAVLSEKVLGSLGNKDLKYRAPPPTSVLVVRLGVGWAGLASEDVVGACWSPRATTPTLTPRQGDFVGAC